MEYDYYLEQKYLYEGRAETFAELSAPLLRMMAQPFEDGRSFKGFVRLLIAPARNLHIIQKQLHGLLKPSTHTQLKKLSSAMSAIKERLAEMDLPWTVFTLGRNAVHTTQQFKEESGSGLCQASVTLRQRRPPCRRCE